MCDKICDKIPFSVFLKMLNEMKNNCPKIIQNVLNMSTFSCPKCTTVVCFHPINVLWKDPRNTLATKSSIQNGFFLTLPFHLLSQFEIKNCKHHVMFPSWIEYCHFHFIQQLVKQHFMFVQFLFNSTTYKSPIKTFYLVQSLKYLLKFYSHDTFLNVYTQNLRKVF